MKTRFLMSCAAIAMLGVGTAAFADDNTKVTPAEKPAVDAALFADRFDFSAEPLDAGLWLGKKRPFLLVDWRHPTL